MAAEARVAGNLYVVVRRGLSHYFPVESPAHPLPRGCVRRYGAGFTKTNNDGYLKSYNERNDDENGFWNGFLNNARFSAACGL